MSQKSPPGSKGGSKGVRPISREAFARGINKSKNLETKLRWVQAKLGQLARKFGRSKKEMYFTLLFAYDERIGTNSAVDTGSSRDKGICIIG